MFGCCGPRARPASVPLNALPDKYNKYKMVAPHRLLSFKRFTGVDAFHQKVLGEVKKIFPTVVSTNTALVLPADLKKFLVEVQRIEASDELVKSIIKEFSSDESGLTEDAFFKLLASPRFGLFNPDHLKVYQNMDKPLNYYYINSSHNTYLIKDQLAGPASVEGYINAFRLGAKSVEIDCWDGPNDEPIVTHGHTLCGTVLFKDIVQVFKEYAFTTSPYPLIVSLEVHCGLPQQGVMAKYLLEILGDLLYYSPADPNTTQLPSPNSLKNKILIKNKKLPDGIKEDEYDTEPENADRDAETEEALEKTPDEPKEEDAKLTHQASSSTFAPEVDKEKLKELTSKKKKEKHQIKVAKSLSDLVIYCQATSFKSFTKCIESFKYSSMSSFSESKSHHFIKNNKDEFEDYNHRWMSRVYPKGSRVDSSNYEPFPMWNVGCALVALNFQTLDRGLQINLGKFTQNGGAGYVLKPRHVIAKEPLEISPKKVTIRVIFAQGTPPKAREVIDPFVEIEVLGVDADLQKQKTKAIDNNPEPIWDETFTFTLTDPALALFRFALMDNELTHGHVLLGVNVIPFTSLTQGYRHFALRDKKHFGVIENSLVLTHVTIEDA